MFAAFASNREALADELELTVWKPLTSFRPPTEIQKKIKSNGAGWSVHQIENADSFLNLDYYALKITKFPSIDGKVLDSKAVFDRFKAHLVSGERPSAKRVEFALSGAPDTVNAAGTLIRLRFRPYTMASCKALAYCGDVGFLKDSSICEKLDAGVAPLLGMGSFDDAYIVVAMSSPRELRVSTVQGGRPLLAPVTESTGKHPVAGNRAFGYTPTSSGMTLYVIGADRFNGVAPKVDDYLSTWGYCSAEIFWREFLNEFEVWVNNNGGIAKRSLAVRKTIDWETAKQKKIWDASGEPGWEN